jgi:hypothetical protein
LPPLSIEAIFDLIFFISNQCVTFEVMKNLPIGIQSLSEIRRRNCVYVDKTPLIHRLSQTSKYYFLSRPRRFGKSLLISTLKELYLGNKALFEGLWIEPYWDWTKTSPVIHLTFDRLDYQGLGLSKAIIKELSRCAKSYQINLTEKTLKSKFSELIQTLSREYGKVVLLVDEYDKPIIDYIETEEREQAKKNQIVLRDFYSVLKGEDENLELVFITGISKFTKVSLFSHLNNLTDITIDAQYASLTGYTQQELESYFDAYLHACCAYLGISRETLLENIKVWYDGYSWDGETRVYNPFGTLNFLHKRVFSNHWFSTGSPSFLIKRMRDLTVYNVENYRISNWVLDKYDMEDIELIPLLFQTGYLTIKAMDKMTGEIVLDYPNLEVRQSMYGFLIDDIAQNPQRLNTGLTMQDLRNAFTTKNLKQVKTILNSLLADLPNETYRTQTEGLFHGLIHLTFSYLGLYASSEVHSSQGHADAVVQTTTDVYIFEFKFNKTAQEALDQMTEKDYAGKYRASGKTITGIGVNFKSDLKTIDDWIEVSL